MRSIDRGYIDRCIDVLEKFKLDYKKAEGHYQKQRIHVAQSCCPYEVGDLVKFKRPRSGHIMEGQVFSIAPPRNIDSPYFYELGMFARKKDGTIAKLAEYITEADIIKEV